MKIFNMPTVRWIILLSVIIFTGCGGSKNNTTSIDPELNVAQEYLERAKNAKGAERSKWLLSATEALYLGQRPEKALGILQQIQIVNLDDINRDWYFSLLGIGLVKANRFEEAINQFSSVTNISQLNLSQQLQYHDNYATALAQLERHFESSQQRISQLNIETDELEQEAIKELLWQQLLALPNPQIFKNSLNTQLIQGWLDLAIIAQTYTSEPEAMIRALEVWSSLYQSVIPENHIPLDLSRAMAVDIYQPQRISVLLPLTGPLAESSEQIRRGLLSARYYSGSNAELLFLDTTNADVLALYQQAVDQNSQFVIGPLQQSAVAKLAESEFLPIPVLAINRILNNELTLPENFYQFGLPIEDEINFIAEHVLSKGEDRGLLLLPESNSGDRALSAFESVFNLNDAQIQEVIRFQQGDDYAKPVQQMLGVDQSLQRHRRLQQLTGVTMEFQARRRQDVDFIFFIANPATGRRIKPFIDFYYAHDIPVYSTSNIFRGIEDEVLDDDLNNIQFPTIPFMVPNHSETQSIQNEITKHWSDSREGVSARLFALGYDSFQIIPELSKLRYFPNYRQPGLSGELLVNEYGHVLRELTWATFTQGKLRVTQIEGPNVAQFQDNNGP